jgi:hypothetical protein
MTDATIITAEAQPDGEEEHGHSHLQRKTRRCLMCHTPFDSAWAGERICRRCKSSAGWQSGQS